MDGDENTDADESEDDEDVATHAHNAQEDGGIHANLLNQLFLVSAHQGEDPGPWLLAQRRRSVLLVGML